LVFAGTFFTRLQFDLGECGTRQTAEALYFLARHSCAGRRRFTTAKLVIQSLGSWLSRFRQRAAYAAGVSTACRQPSHFSFAGPKEK
jgi:hypothetical protein